MIDEDFEWDDEKATSNAEKHGVTFEQALSVFSDPFAIELLDDRENYNEDRYILIGMAAVTLLVIVYTERNDKNRIISARRAEANERRFYHEQNK